MEIKVGQWLRTNKNQLFKCTNEELDGLIAIKVANTPQELIEDNDIGFIEEWQSIEMLYISDDGVYCYMDSKRHFIGKDITITKILTPNSNGGYDLQWELKQ